jgi:hypothetical protein
MINTLLHIQKLDPQHSEITSPVTLNIFNNDKGRSVFLNSTENVGTVALLEFLPNAGIRGNHYHLSKSETMYIIYGKLKLYYWMPTEPEIKDAIVGCSELITIKPNLAHAYQALEPTLAFEVGSLPYNLEDTVYDYRITNES